MKDRAANEAAVTIEAVGRLERRAEALRERIAARGGPNAETTSESAELASLEIAIATLDAFRWRRSIDEPISDEISEIAAATVDDAGGVLLLRRQDADWKCTCGCERAVAGDRIYRWRPIVGSAAAPEDDHRPIVSLTSYRGRQRLAIIEDRIRYLTARAEELKRQGSPARYEKNELQAITWIRDLALREDGGKTHA